MGIHNYELRCANMLETVKKSDIPERNKKFILDFVNDLVLNNLSKPRQLRYMNTLLALAKKLGKNFDTATIEDLKKIVGEIQQNSRYSPWTKKTYKVIIRRFYAWLHGMDKTKEYPPIVKWISLRMIKSECKLPAEGDLLTPEEIEKMLTVANHPRDKALIAALWESGARISEVGNLLLKHLSFDKHGAVMTVQGKTGSRQVRLIWSIPYLSTWVSNHPFKEERTSPLWVNIGSRNHKKVMCYGNLRQLVINIARAAGIKKRVHPHLFRHSRATFLAQHLTEFQMNQYLGWVQGGDMAATYVHLNGKNLDDSLLALNGMKKKEEEMDKQLLPSRCARCQTVNAHDTKYCRQCGGIMNLKDALELEEQQQRELLERRGKDNILKELFADPQIQNLIVEKLRERGVSSLSF